MPNETLWQRIVTFIRPFITWQQFFELFRYGLAGIVAATVNIGGFYLLSMYMWYLYASVIAFVISFLTSFTLQKFWTFRNMSITRIPVQSSISFAITCGNLVLNTICMYVFVGVLGYHAFYTQVIVVLFIAAESFFVYKFIIFRR